MATILSTLLGVPWPCLRDWDLYVEGEHGSVLQSYLFKNFHRTLRIISPFYKQNANVYITPSEGNACYFYDLEF